MFVSENAIQVLETTYTTGRILTDGNGIKEVGTGIDGYYNGTKLKL